MSVILASQNQHKVEELRQILTGVDLEAMPEGIEMPEEDGETFSDNALIKARAIRAELGGPVLADDSGIEVKALGGRPGVRSARYAGEHATDGENLSKALADLAASGGEPDARYVCVIAYIDEDGEEHLFEGFCTGHLILDPRGDGGFGYDPAFVPDATGPDDHRTMAEVSPAEKHSISHRGAAARKLADFLLAGS
ncbi:MAG: RdgB/HAM1 family non-canonical purine NTP pyrophosphatase [Actinomycetota bacterium]|nr:RdgB/HAM1 family non-canonical purine NTP pyrophosphatase [Actinomycetota bacterium]